MDANCNFLMCNEANGNMHIDMSIKPNMVVEMIISNAASGIRDYEQLQNLPSINNEKLIGNYNEIDPTVPNWAKNEEPEEITLIRMKEIWDSIFNE